jgi:hypothetical protein
VRIAASRIRLPDLDERVGQRPPVLVHHASGQDDALADGLAGVLPREVVLRRGERAVRVRRAGELRHRLRNLDRRLVRVPQPVAAVVGIRDVRVHAIADAWIGAR